MDLTESEAKGFWPIYEAYQKGLEGIKQRIAKLFESYAKAYQEGNLSDEKTRELTAGLVTIQKEEGGFQGIYLPKLNKVLPLKKVAR